MPSKLYDKALAQTRAFHEKTDRFNGRFFLRYVDDVKELVENYGCKTLLDYGCGKGYQWQTVVSSDEDGTRQQTLAGWLGVTPTLYDPGWKPFAKEPEGTFDIVVCTQVLGSIPIIDLPWVVGRLSSYANKVVYVGEKLAPVRKQVHANMKGEMPHEWTREQWEEALRRPGWKPTWLRTRNKTTGELILGLVSGNSPAPEDTQSDSSDGPTTITRGY